MGEHCLSHDELRLSAVEPALGKKPETWQEISLASRIKVARNVDTIDEAWGREADLGYRWCLQCCG